MHTIFQRIALGLLVLCTRRWRDWYFRGQVGPEPNCVEGYWDWIYFIKFGLPHLSIPELEELDIYSWWNRPRPDPDPLSFWNSGIESLFLDSLEITLDAPHLQPNILNEIYGNREVRLASVNRVMAGFEEAASHLREEAAKLERLQ